MNYNSREACRNCIYDSPLFEGLSHDELCDLANFATTRLFRRGEAVFSEGDEIQFITFLKSGLVKMFTHCADSREQIISIARPNDCIGLLSVFSNPKHQYSITAIEDSTIYYVELSRLKQIIRNNGAFGLKLIGRISNAADVIIKNAYRISRKNLRGRIAMILLEFAEDIYQSPQFDLPVSRKEIAELISMTSENVIRILSEFRRDEIISIQGKTITILNMELLKAIEKNG